MPMELSTKEVEREPKRGATVLTEERERRRYAGDSTVRVGVASQKTNAIISMSARDVERAGMESHPAQERSISEDENGMRPRYLRYNVWDPESDFSLNTADWTLTARPLERPPQSVLDDNLVMKTLNDNEHLFKIVTPIKVDVFEAYLATHPNQPFVKSVCQGLREGFWPWATVPGSEYPVINDRSKPTPEDNGRAEFLRTQQDTEILKGRLSPAFYELLPGMYCMLIFAVPKCYDRMISEKKVTRPGIEPRTFPLLGGCSTN